MARADAAAEACGRCGSVAGRANPNTVKGDHMMPCLPLPATPIEANATTDIEFTSLDPGRYEGRLLPADGDEVIDTVEVQVAGPGGTLWGSSRLRHDW